MKSLVKENMQKQTKQGYSAIAREFSTTRERNWPEIVMLADKYIKDGMKILDLGCGNGRLYKVLQNRSIHYLGVDVNQQFIKTASAQYAQPQFVCADLLRFSSDKTFDAIFALAVMNHFPRVHHGLFMKKLTELTAPNGIVIMSNWNMWNFSNKKSFWRFLKDRIFLREKDFEAKYATSKNSLGWRDVLTVWKKENRTVILPYYSFTLSQVKRYFRDFGFEMLQAGYFSFGKNSTWWKANNMVLVAKKLSTHEKK